MDGRVCVSCGSCDMDMRLTHWPEAGRLPQQCRMASLRMCLYPGTFTSKLPKHQGPQANMNLSKTVLKS